MRQRLDRIHLHPDFSLALGIITRLDPHQTVLAGGCVRDALLDRAAADLDLATAAEPALVARTFSRTVDVGRAFGTVVVVEDGRNIEVTTFRREEAYLDGRRPSGVTFTDAAEDARRRDFTVNALFYDPREEVLFDDVGGVADLDQRRLRTVGDPRARFAEDHLRMLRAVRFVAQLEFTLDADAARAIRELKSYITSVAGERVLAEMKRLLTSPGRARALRLAEDLGLLALIWSDAVVDRPGDHFTSWENAFAHHAGDLGRALATLRTWRAPRESQRRVNDQLRGLGVCADSRASLAARVRVLGSAVGDEVRALAAARGIDVAEAEERLAVLGGTLPPPLVTGEDLKGRGVSPGRKMGELLERLYDAQLDGEISDLAGALERARAWRP